MMTMKLTMTTDANRKKKRVHASYLRARERDVHGVCLFVSLSLLVVLVKKTNWGMCYSYYIYRRVYEMKTNTRRRRKNLFFFGVLLFSSDEKTLLLLLTRDFVELLRDERIILRPVLKLAVFLRCQLNPILNPSDTLNSKFPSLKNGQIISFN